MSLDAELLTDLSHDELEALADGMLAPSTQQRLDALLKRKADGALSEEECRELDGLLRRVDQLTILKTRARYTLQSQKVGARDA